MTMLDHNCGHGSGNFMLTEPSASMRVVNSRPFRVGRGFPSVRVTMSQSHYRNVRRLYGDRVTPKARIVVLSSTFRRQCMGPKVGVLLMSCRQLVYRSALLPTKQVHRPRGKGDQTRVIVIAGYPGSVAPVSLEILDGRVRLCPCRRLCFAALACNGLRPLFATKGTISLGRVRGSGRVLLIANVTSPTGLVRSLSPCGRRVRSLTFDSRRSFATESVRLVGGHFVGLPRNGHVVVAARGSSMQLTTRPLVSRVLGPCVCVLPVRMTFLRSRRRLFGSGVASCIEGGSEGDGFS